MQRLTGLFALLALVSAVAQAQQNASPSLMAWPEGEVGHYLHEVQATNRTRAQVATGKNGAVTVALNGFAARAGLEALKQGGSAADAALTAALAQISITAGGPVSFFGVLSMVYYDAESGEVVALNAEWNTVRGETDPMSIPGRITLATKDSVLGTEPSGRTALVGGFMKGVEAAHRRFGRLPFAALFEPAIYIAEHGFPVRPKFAEVLAKRSADLSRLPETRAVFTKPDGSFYKEGDPLRQPVLARTLRTIAARGADYMYDGPWGKKLIAAVQADGGKMTLEDLRAYEVLWQQPLTAEIGNWRIHVSPPPNEGGVSLVEALHLAMEAKLSERDHWSKSGEVLRDAVNIGIAAYLPYRSPASLAKTFQGIDFSPESRIRREHARQLWRHYQEGSTFGRWQKAPDQPRHSNDVVAIDAQGNMAAITHTINSVAWGKTGIFVDGISIGDPGSFQQARIARVKPGERLPAKTETGIVFHKGKAVLAFASMGAGLHQRTFQALMNIMAHGMTVDEAVDAADFFLPEVTAAGTRIVVPKGRFPRSVLEKTGYAFVEVDPAAAGLGRDGIWVAIQRDPESSALRATSNNRKNSFAVAF